MFSLEKAIEEWRRQMLAAGVKTPLPMEELENHLRDDLERQMRSGVEAEQAFQIAVSRLGQAGALKKEFAKGTGFWTANHVLGILWGVGCLISFYTVCQLPDPDPFVSGPDPSKLLLWTPLLFNLNAYLIYAAGVVGSIFLFRGAKWGRKIVRMLALLLAIACIAQLFDLRSNVGWRTWCAFIAVFSIVSIWLLHRPERAASAH